VSECNDIMDMLPKSAVMVSHLLPLVSSTDVCRSIRELLRLFYLKPDIEGHLSTPCPLPESWPHVGHLRNVFHDIVRRAL
jgi:hypothetical protein